MESPTEQPGQRSDPFKIAIVVAIATLSFAVFLPALGAKLVDWDDQMLLIENDRYQGLTLDNLRWMFSSALLGHYQPLTWVSYAIDWHIWGDPREDAFGYHWTNLALHTANALLFYALALRLIPLATRRPEPHAGSGPDNRLRLCAAAAALAFSIHPLRVESVAWVTERRDVLSGFFLLLTTIAYLNSVSSGEARLRSKAWYAVSLGLLALSLLSKAWGMTFFAVALVIDWWPLRRLPMDPHGWLARDRWPVLLQKIPYALLGVASAAAASLAQRGGTDRLGAMRSLEQWGVTERIVQAFYGLVWYVRKTLWPTDLAALYQLPPSIDPLAPGYIVCYVAVAGGAALLFLYRRRVPAIAAAAAAYAILVAPVLGLVQSGEQFVADRYSYISCMSWAFLAGGGLYLLLTTGPRGLPRVLGMAAAAAALALLPPLTWRQTTTWQDSSTLWAHAARVAPSAATHVNYGMDLEVRGELMPAIEHFRTATKLNARDGRAWFVLANSTEDAGDLAARAGDREAAAAFFAESERAFLRAIETMDKAYQAHANLGRLYMRHLGRQDEAIEMYRRAVAAAEASPPEDFSPLPYLALGDALHRTGDIEGARRAFEKAAQHPETRDRALDHLRRLPPP